jgi:hypothetical protein
MDCLVISITGFNRSNTGEEDDDDDDDDDDDVHTGCPRRKGQYSGRSWYRSF